MKEIVSHQKLYHPIPDILTLYEKMDFSSLLNYGDGGHYTVPKNYGGWLSILVPITTHVQVSICDDKV